MLRINKFLYFEFDSMGQTALHWAVKKSHMDIVKLLLDQKLDVNVYDKLGKTPLFYSMF